jgi:hypothetical protein
MVHKFNWLKKKHACCKYDPLHRKMSRNMHRLIVYSEYYILSQNLGRFGYRFFTDFQ